MKKIKGFVNKNYKVVIGIIIGITISIGIGVSAVATKDITYDNSKSGLTSTNLQGAIDETYNKAKKISHCAEISGDAVTFKLGDYVQMAPSSTSYITDTSMTGYTTTQTINPSELNLWRVIRINSNNTVDMVSEYVSSASVYFTGQTGYQNYVGYLNTIAHQYENSCYTVESRHMGYSTQTPYITDTTALTGTSSLPNSSTSSSNVTSATEVKGLGDMGYETDYNLVNTALGTLVANKVGTTTAKAYWLASRRYDYIHQYAYDDKYDTNWGFGGRYIYTYGSLNSDNLCGYCSGPSCHSDSVRSYSYNAGKAVRPIVTLKSGVKASSGDGSSSSPYVLP